MGVYEVGILSVPYHYPVPLKVAGSGGEKLNGIYALLIETLFTNSPKMKTQKIANHGGQGVVR